ncbi:MAG TPA: 30S ribosome-binding factor RbfA, partial [Candidatus Dormibacteraeota bacterium]|nr:30S ribosome-binding factor RbfA [Candidatus Dormibacteraeota bacterium]
DKVAAQLHEELSGILRTLADPRLAQANIVRVDLAADLQNAKIRVSTLGGDAEHKAMIEALQHARGHVRHELAQRLRNNLRRVPELRFIDDRNTEYAVHIGSLIETLKETEHEG